MCCLHLQGVLPSQWPRLGLGRGRSTHLLHILLSAEGWCVAEVLDCVLSQGGTRCTGLDFKAGGTALVDVVARRLGPFGGALFGNIGLSLVRSNLLEGAVVPRRIHGCGDSISLPMVLAISEDLPVRLHLANILVPDLSGRLAPSLRGLAPCAE